MDSVIVLWTHDLRESLRRWTVIVPSLFSSLLGLAVMVYGFRATFRDSTYYLTFATGWIAYAMVLTGVTASIVATVDLTTTRVRYLLSLPVPTGAVVLGKLWGACTVALVISLVLLGVSEPLILHLSLRALLVTLLALVMQSIAVVGLITGLTYLARDISRMSIISSLAVGALNYISAVYFPPETFPPALRWLIYANPLTHSVGVIRSLLAGSPDYTELWVLTLITSVLLVVGYLSMLRTIRRTAA